MIDAEKMKFYRKSKGLTQPGLAEASGLSLRQITRIETEAGDTTTEALASIAKALDVNPADLLKNSSNPTASPAQ